MVAGDEPDHKEIALEEGWSASVSSSAGSVVVPRGPADTVREEGPAALLLFVLIVVGGLVLLATALVLSGDLGREWLDAITSDSEVGLVLTTVFIIYIELGRDRRDREKERRGRAEREREVVEAAKSDTTKQMK